MLRVWLAALKGASIPEVQHFVFFVGERAPSDLNLPPFEFFEYEDHKPGELSIGYYHNMGAALASSPWIMKLDVDTLPNVQYFWSLLPVLEKAGEREWFNGGMLYTNQVAASTILNEQHMPLDTHTYKMILKDRRTYTTGGFTGPAATNFICRRHVYLNLGGCDKRFRGYGWEDYQQIYALERWQLGRDPLPGLIAPSNVTKRCRDEISRPKAQELFERDEFLCLLHRWHAPARGTIYKNPTVMARNATILLDCIQSYGRQEETASD